MGAAPRDVDAGAVARGAAIDSRNVREGDLFFALRGRVDGADFAADALGRGAVAVVASRPLSGPTLVVEDPVAALQDLARWSLRRPGAGAPTVVGITGSVGKTTTKDALSAVLRSAGTRVAATVGNFNNEIGLPLTVLGAPDNAEVLVLEMGATHVGNIAELCRVAPPEHGILTAIAPAHLESFGSLEALAATKGELAASLPSSGTFVSPAGVPEAAVVQLLYQVFKFGGAVSGGNQRRDDSPGGCSGDVPPPVSPLFGRGQRPRQADAFYPAAFEDGVCFEPLFRGHVYPPEIDSGTVSRRGAAFQSVADTVIPVSGVKLHPFGRLYGGE